jgi:hypothetical protein
MQGGACQQRDGECFDRIEDPWVPLNPKQGRKSELKEGNAFYVLTSLAPRTNGGDAEKSCLRSKWALLSIGDAQAAFDAQQSSNWLVRMVCRTMICPTIYRQFPFLSNTRA